MLKLAISGCDGIGKTQQIHLMGLDTKKITHSIKRLVEYSNEWPVLSQTAFHEWWFNQVNFDTLAKIIIEALNIRNASCIPDRVNVFDRGTMMFKAVLAATLSTKDLECIEDAYSRVDNLFDFLLNYNPNEYELLLVPDITYLQNINPLIQIADPRNHSYTLEQLARYTKYQKYLGFAIEHYYKGISQNQKIVVNSCLLNIQNEIRSRVNNTFGIKLPIICENFELGIGLGGLSESGKSSLGDMLSKQYGFYRLKLRYFEDLLIRTDQSVQTDKMGLEFASFLHHHPYVTKATVESLHDPALPTYFKLLFGDRFYSVFLSVPEEIRINRLATATGMSIKETTAIVRNKDKIKQSRGVQHLEGIADLVINNTADRLENVVREIVQYLKIKT